MRPGQNAPRCAPSSTDTADTEMKWTIATITNTGACRSSIRVHPPLDSGSHPDVTRHTSSVSGIQSRK